MWSTYSSRPGQSVAADTSVAAVMFKPRSVSKTIGDVTPGGGGAATCVPAGAFAMPACGLSWNTIGARAASARAGSRPRNEKNASRCLSGAWFSRLRIVSIRCAKICSTAAPAESAGGFHSGRYPARRARNSATSATASRSSSTGPAIGVTAPSPPSGRTGRPGCAVCSRCASGTSWRSARGRSGSSRFARRP